MAAQQVRKRSSSPPSVLETGCFDGKVLNFITPTPRRYLGLDANWEGGLDLAKIKWAEFPGAEFRKCQTPEEVPTGERFDVAIVMETLEHLPDDVLDGYIARLREVTDGYLLVTSPNESGPVCFAKQIVKKALLGGSSFSWADIWNATLGLTRRIVRDEHRGFNYRHFIETLRKSFDVVSVQGIPFPWAPPYLNFTVGIVLAPKSKGRTTGS
ncbi:MAG: methyltransferase domain-containing protein [Bryobacterales bacterium]|nr:methyltransferase domain-containing protein [Bryobacterales bacterium]